MKKIGLLFCIFIIATAMAMTVNESWGKERVVYDNTVNFEGSYLGDIFPGVEGYDGTKIGELVRLAGRSRHITEFQTILLGESFNNPEFTADVRLVLRRLNLRSDAPGPIIWESDWKSLNFVSKVEQPVSFAVPRVRVPQFFIWTLEFTGFETWMEGVAIPFCDPPVVGHSADGYYYFDYMLQVWRFQEIAGTSFYAKIYADKYKY